MKNKRLNEIVLKLTIIEVIVIILCVPSTTWSIGEFLIYLFMDSIFNWWSIGILSTLILVLIILIGFEFRFRLKIIDELKNSSIKSDSNQNIVLSTDTSDPTAGDGTIEVVIDYSNKHLKNKSWLKRLKKLIQNENPNQTSTGHNK